MALSQNIVAVAFDFDGVVADTMPALTRLAVKLFMERFSVDTPKAARSLYLSTTGLPFYTQLQELFPQRLASYRRGVASVFELEKEKLIQRARPFEDIAGALMSLHTRGVLVALCSSTRGAIIAKFLEGGLARRLRIKFDWVGSIERGSKLVQLRKVMQRWDLRPDQLLFVGDSANDARFAWRVGVWFGPVHCRAGGRRVIQALNFT